MSATSLIPSAKAASSGHSWCTSDRMISGFGLILLITGLVLFIIRSTIVSPSISLGSAPAAFTGVGTSIFCLSFLSDGCVQGCNALGKSIQNSEDERNAIDTEHPIEPLSLNITTKNFFESEGVFGLPQELLQLLDQWRAFRAGMLHVPPADAGFLLSGPPGCGKTRVAELVWKLLGGIHVPKASRDLQSMYHGGTERAMTNLFRVPETQFRVITIDEIDGLLPRRSEDNLNPRNNSIDIHRIDTQNVSQFLSVVQGNVSGNAPRRYILIGTTNRPRALDDAILRNGRLGTHFQLTLPNATTIQQILSFHLRDIAIKKPDSDQNHSEEEKNALLARMAERLCQARTNGANVVTLLTSMKNRAQMGGHPTVISYKAWLQNNATIIQDILTFHLRDVAIKKPDVEENYSEEEKKYLLSQMAERLCQANKTGANVVALLTSMKNKARTDGHPEVIFHEEWLQNNATIIQDILTFHLRDVAIKKPGAQENYNEEEKNAPLAQMATELCEMRMTGANAVMFVTLIKNKARTDGHPEVIFYEDCFESEGLTNPQNRSRDETPSTPAPLPPSSN